MVGALFILDIRLDATTFHGWPLSKATRTGWA